MQTKRVAVLVSSQGTILQAIYDAGIEVSVVASDRMCPAIDVAYSLGIPVILLERTDFSAQFDQVGYSCELRDRLKADRINVVAMAGFGTVLSKEFFGAFEIVLNTHPSLLPDFPGKNAIEQAFAAGVSETGCTVHIATKIVDDPSHILVQVRIPIHTDDTVETVRERIKEEERRVYPSVIKSRVQNDVY